MLGNRLDPGIQGLRCNRHTLNSQQLAVLLPLLLLVLIQVLLQHLRQLQLILLPKLHCCHAVLWRMAAPPSAGVLAAGTFNCMSSAAGPQVLCALLPEGPGSGGSSCRGKAEPPSAGLRNAAPMGAQAGHERPTMHTKTHQQQRICGLGGLNSDPRFGPCCPAPAPCATHRVPEWRRCTHETCIRLQSKLSARCILPHASLISTPRLPSSQTGT